jgi:UDP-N-acetylglucosamine acyltransferase
MIHPTAIIHPSAKLAADVRVGPYSIIDEHVEIGEGTVIDSHCVITGHTRIGRHNRFHAFSTIGGAPQDKKFAGEPTRLEIGDHNTVREYCTFNTGTAQDKGVTRIGSHNWIMAYVHIAHDCEVGDHTIFANNATLAGHVSVGSHAILGGFTGVHQFCRVGEHSFCGVGTVLTQDLPPFVMCNGNPAATHGINAEGLKRRGFSADAVSAIKRAYKTLYREGLTLADARDKIGHMLNQTPELGGFHAFISAPGRGIVR